MIQTMEGRMEIDGMLSQLRFELEQLNQVILTLERLAGGRGGRRIGRPPNWLREAAKKAKIGGGFTNSARLSPTPPTRGRAHRAKAKQAAPTSR